MTIKTLLLNDIRIDGNTQSRVSISLETVDRYAEMEPEDLPPVVVFFDGADNWLADGFHRYHGTVKRGKKQNIIADIRKGTQRDAVLYSLNANVKHGLSLTPDDKRKAVLVMLEDPEWAELSDRAISRHCGCGHPLVSRLREQKAADAVAASGINSTPKEDDQPATGINSTTATEDAKPASGINSTKPPADTTAKDAAKAAADQIAADAHGDSDPIAMLEEAQKKIEALQGELFAAQADDQKAETLKWKRLVDVATRRQDELMDTVNAREKELQRMANWLRRIGNALKEDDNAKLPALVEALARTAKVAA